MTLLAAWLVCCGPSRAVASDLTIELPRLDTKAPVAVTASSGKRWRQGAYEIVWLRDCEIRQGALTARASEAVLWIDQASPFSNGMTKVLTYLEAGRYGQVVLEHQNGVGAPQRVVDKSWFGRLYTEAAVRIDAPVSQADPKSPPPVYHRGRQAGPFADKAVRPAQLERSSPARGGREEQQLRLGGRNLTIIGRGNGRVDFDLRNNPATNESVLVIPSAVNIILDDVQVSNASQMGDVALGKIDLEADSVVIWTANLQNQDFNGGGLRLGEDLPLEVYMEGNIVFRQGDSVIYAKQMYYDVNQKTGVIMDAELLTPVPHYEGLMRLKADVLQQVDRSHYQAFGAALTSSRMGVPSYWIQSESLELEDVKTPATDFLTGEPIIDPNTRGPMVEHEFLATSHNNFLYIGGAPILYWPTIATDLQRPTYYIDNLRIKNDNVFGAQILTDIDMYQVLGIRRPPRGTDWTISPDYMSERGPAFGTSFQYQNMNILGHSGDNLGLFDAWGINDTGVDSLGADRLAVTPETEWRGRVLFQHRHDLAIGWQLTAEAGLHSDRNFVEQYLENEWDEYKDQTTGIEIKRYFGSNSLSLTTDTRVNDFYTQTEWLPRLDHFLIGQSVFADHITWSAHTHVGYGHLETASGPATPEPPPATLPWEMTTGMVPFADREGVRIASRHEVDAPFELGPVKVVPYALGEVAHWHEDLDADDVTRVYGQAGVRTSMPIWRADPTVRSALFNLRGLAHKVSLESELLFAEADENLTRLALYDPLDDDSQEHFIRRFIPSTFGGVLPAKYDARFFAVRNGLQSWVSSPTTEVAEDLMLFRVAARQRWQTKRGLPGQERIVDWIAFDVEGSLFPKAARDNFGEDAGLLNYDFRWHIGDRLTVLSDGFVDIFDDGLRTFTLGGLITRPEQGSLYVGFRTIEGPITSNILSAALSYRMTEKWIAQLGTSFDFGPTGNIGQRISMIRVGESALLRFGFNVDEGRNNVGLQFSIEPRFLPRGRLGRVGGVQIPPAGARGLE
ncbi:MAG: organic solvent tolerance protein OstA [Pirellulaceae bacterium]|nr:organic solvent tolerance protein OstA [Pirellulaceae bacterium]